MGKFKLQVIGAICGFIVTTILVLTTMSYMAYKEESVLLTKEILQQKNATVRAELHERFQHLKALLSSVALEEQDFTASGLSPEAKLALQPLNTVLDKTSSGVYVVRRSGEIYDLNSKLDFNVQALQRSYYTAVFQQGKNDYFSEPYLSKTTGKQVVGVIVKVNRDIAVLASVFLDDLLGAARLRDDLFIYTSKGLIVHAPYPEYIGQKIQDKRPAYQAFSAQNQQLHYSAEVNDQSVDFTAFWGEFATNGWQYVSFVRDETIEADANHQLTRALVTGGFMLLFSCVMSSWLINKLVLKPVGGEPKAIEAMIAKMAQGDFRLPDSGDNDVNNQTGIYHSTLLLNHQLRQLINNTNAISDEVASATEHLATAMEHNKNNGQDELAQVEQISTAVTELSSTSQEMSQKATSAEEQAMQAREHVEQGKQKVEENIQLNNNVHQSFTDSAQLIDELRQFAIEIDSVTEVINTISEQTNLLALNAAIEAARAGEHGRGFAVVADEVRSLASKTQQSTVNIQQIIEKLQSQSQKAQQNMQHNMRLIGQSVDLTEAIDESFQAIFESVTAISDVNTLVATSSQEQYHVTEDIALNTTKAHDLVHQNVALIEKTLQSCKALSDAAERQKKELGLFKIV